MKERTIQANWKPYERRPTWSFVSTPELAQILNISVQGVHNHILRGKLPPPDDNPYSRRNKSWYRISKVRSYLEETPEEDIHWAFIKQYLPEGINSIEQAEYVARLCYDILGMENPRISH